MQTAGLVFLGLYCTQVSPCLIQFKHNRLLVILGKKGKADKQRPSGHFPFTRYLDPMNPVIHSLNTDQDPGTMLSEQNSSEQKQMFPAMMKI